jgi:hypothetical protein
VVEKTRGGEPDRTPEGEPDVTFVKVWEGFVEVSRTDHDPIRFRLNHRKARSVSVTDPRGRDAGTAGVTGIWGTLPAPRPNRPKSLTLTGFQGELARLIGQEPAAEIVRTIRSEFAGKPPKTDVGG